MRQYFVISLEYMASDKGYTEQELLDLLRQAIGNEYDTDWYSVGEIVAIDK
jgi:hypothetical protein